MIHKMVRVLLLTQNSSLAKRIGSSLSYAQTQVFNVTWVQDKTKTLELINSTFIDIILLDLSVTNDESPTFVKQLLSYSPRAVIILFCSDTDRAISMQAMTQGATSAIDKHSLGDNWLMKILGYNLLRTQVLKLPNVSAKALHEISDTLSLGIMVSDLFGHIIYSNPAFSSITGYSIDQSLGQHWTAQIYHEDRIRLLKEWQDAQKDEQMICSDVCLLHQHNEIRPIRIRATAIEKYKKSYGYIITVENLTEKDNKVASKDALVSRFAINSADLLPATTAQLTLDMMSDAILSTDIDNKVLYMNKSASILTGFNHHESIGCLLADIVKVKPNVAEGKVEATFCQSQQTMDCTLVHKDGTEIPIEESARPMLNDYGEKIGVVFIFRDVTQSELKAIKMTHLAQHDPLTSLPNRLLFQERLNQAIVLAKRHTKRLAVLYLDIDLFKKVNDLHGHEIGDKLLRSIAKRMTDTVRLSDTVCRQGGDEFLILLSEIEHANDAVTFSSKLLNSLINPHQIDGKKISVHMSIGIRIFPHDDEINEHNINDGELSHILIDNADKAMYQAKLRGHDGYLIFQQTSNF